MSGGIATTLKLLAGRDNQAATDVLVAALDSSDRQIRDGALAALIGRHHEEAQRQVLSRWHMLSDRWKAEIGQHPGWLSAAIRRALVDERQQYQCACAAAVATGDYELIPALVDAVMDRPRSQAAAAAQAVLELAEALAEQLAAGHPRPRRRPIAGKSAHGTRRRVLPCLEQAVVRIKQHGRREIVEAFLLLAHREDAFLKRLLQSPFNAEPGPPGSPDAAGPGATQTAHHEKRGSRRVDSAICNQQFAILEAVATVLSSSSRPGIERLLLSYLDDPHAPLGVIQLIGRRSDVAFLRHLAQKIGAEPSQTVRANIRRITSIPWITGNLGVLDTLSEAEQSGAVNLVVCSAVPREQALAVVAYILRHGKLAGRRVAARLLAQFEGPQADELTVRMLEDACPQVRAAAAGQLRQRGIPGAIQRLLALLDSPHQVEREVAQASLEEFRFDRFAARFDQMTQEARITTGRLVRRIDPQALWLVRQELGSASRGRRKRALEMAVAMDAVAELADAIGELLSDEDVFLRIEAIGALASIDTSRHLQAAAAARQALRDALLDPHPLVQEAAESALQRLIRDDAVPAAGVCPTYPGDGLPATAMSLDTVEMADV